jgi:hypothetical protein
VWAHRTATGALPAPEQCAQAPRAWRRDHGRDAASLAELQPLEFRQVRRTEHEQLFGALLQAHHYLGYTRPVGEHLKYLVYAKDRLVACLAWSSAPRHLAPRDRFIGRSAQARRQNIRFIAYNSRFLVLPWIEVSNLASHLLGRLAKRLSRD